MSIFIEYQEAHHKWKVANTFATEKYGKCHRCSLKLEDIMTNYTTNSHLTLGMTPYILYWAHHIAQNVTCFALVTPCISQYHQFESQICSDVYPHSVPSLRSEYPLWTSAIFPRIMHHFKVHWSFQSNFIPNEVEFIVCVHTTLRVTQHLQLLTDIISNSMDSHTHNLDVSSSA
jgi:hypothetical protein